MDLGGETIRCRLVGNYVIGPRIGSGSFAVVWRSRHRHLGTEFAIKEIDKKHLNDNLRKEISILRNIDHPNIIRLFEAIETEERIYLVLEYCEGGDLGAYIHKHGRVSEDVARHFMKQLAAGLQVLRENHLIHRDLKPQNLLLSSKEVTPLLKIGDFGFARYLTPHEGLAETLCGSPLYMAPEIIKNQKYDAKADLWSVGTILYQLVIGKPPFDGNSQLQLFQNILTSTELRFPDGALKVLHPDCVELCRCLLRQNPVERITFEEFFYHKFLMDTRVGVETELSSQIARVESMVITDVWRPKSHQEDRFKVSDVSIKRDYSPAEDGRREPKKDHDITSSTINVCEVMTGTSSHKLRQSTESGPHSSRQTRVVDSLESIEREYVLVHSNFASMEILTSSLGASLKESSTTKPCALAPKTSDQPMPIAPEMMDHAVSAAENTSWSGTVPSSASGAPCRLREAQGLFILHPSTRLQLLHQYVSALSDLAEEKFNAGFFLESFSVGLVVLAIWKEALRACSSWLSSTGGTDRPESSLGNESAGKGASSCPSTTEDTTDFRKHLSVSMWAEQGFIAACDRAEKLSKYLQDVDGSAEMPDAMEIIFQTALAAGRNGAADQLIGNRESAATMYSKALLLFSFILAEAPSLPVSPTFCLAPDDKQRLQKYIKNLETHLSHSQMPQPSTKLNPEFITK